jgi:hypothetical protein
MQDSYIQSRSTAIESIESTIAELGQIFNQLAHMVAEQRETVQRIDADTLDIASNVGGAQRELLKYYASISSNRWLMLKVFGVLIVFVSLPIAKLFLGDIRLTAALSVPDLYLSNMIDLSSCGCASLRLYILFMHMHIMNHGPLPNIPNLHLYQMLSDRQCVYTRAPVLCPCAAPPCYLLPPSVLTAVVLVTDRPGALCARQVAFP